MQQIKWQMDRWGLVYETSVLSNPPVSTPQVESISYACISQLWLVHLTAHRGSGGEGLLHAKLHETTSGVSTSVSSFPAVSSHTPF